RQDLAIQARHARLALRDDLGLERSLPIARRDDLDFAELPLQSFLAFPVAPVAIRLRLLVMLFISQVVCHLRFQRPFHQRLGQLPQQTVLAGQILRLPVVCQQAVDYFLFNCHWFSKSVGEPAITQSVLYPRILVTSRARGSGLPRESRSGSGPAASPVQQAPSWRRSSVAGTPASSRPAH